VSEGVWTSCHSNGLNSEAVFRYFNETRTYENGADYIIPYLDTEGKVRSIERKSQWFTFTASNNQAVTLDIVGSLSDYDFHSITIMKYNGAYYDNFEKLKEQGLDSAYIQFTKILRGNNGKITLGNYFCDVEARYFVAVTNRPLATVSYKLRLTSVVNQQSDLGDNCVDAKSLKIEDYGSYSVETSTNCHSYGGSPFEEMTDNVISTWFRVDVSGLKKFDLSLKIDGFISSYALYGGTCGALTKLTGN
jgi:hypothetical protein